MYKSQKVSFCRKFEKFANQLFTCGHLGCMQQYLTHIRIVVPLVPSQSTSTNNSFAIVGQHSPSVTSLWPVHATTLHGIPSMCAHSLHFTLPCVPHHRIIASSPEAYFAARSPCVRVRIECRQVLVTIPPSAAGVDSTHKKEKAYLVRKKTTLFSCCCYCVHYFCDFSLFFLGTFHSWSDSCSMRDLSRGAVVPTRQTKC